jgi:hypothetical protein
MVSEAWGVRAGAICGSGEHFERRRSVAKSMAESRFATRQAVPCLAVRATGTAGLGAGPERLVKDALDRARAAAAFGAAAEATIELLGIPGQIFRTMDGTANIVVGQDVTGTNNHESEALTKAADASSILKSRGGCKRKKPILK